MKNDLYSFLICSNCKLSEINDSLGKCDSCGFALTHTKGVLRFIDSEYHSNFGYQWNKFSKVQLDSFNGSNESESRLLSQSNLTPKDFKGKTVLEVGAGNGRFTELLLKYGAKVIAIDYSTAIEANYKNNSSKDNEVIFMQADLFNLPIKKNVFDIVICYGVIQHTGDNKKALNELCQYPRDGGMLLVDIYSSGLKYFNPWVYLIRPFFSLIKTSDEKRLKIVQAFVDFSFPLQLWLLRLSYKKSGFLKYIRYIVNRSPNSVYGINLYLDGKVNINTAKDWCVLDTYDGWAPKHDHPVSRFKWEAMLKYSAGKYGFSVKNISASGQGHTAILTKN